MHASSQEDDDGLEAAADALLEASRALVGVAARSLPDSEDVTLVQFRALVVLAREGDVTPTRLAEILGIHQSSVTRLCDRLVRKQLVRRVPGVEDRREVTIRLSAAGRRFVARVSDRRRAEIRSICARMQPKARRQAAVALSAFAEAAGERAPAVDLFGWPEP